MKSLPLLAVAFLYFAAPPLSQASSVSWSAVGANQVALSDGTPASDGWLLRLGGFDVSKANVSANAGNVSYLNSHFIEFGTATFGNSALTAGNFGAWESVSNGDTSNVGPSHINLELDSMYLWAFNSATIGGATQHLLVSSSLSHWAFPLESGFPNTTAIDLGDLTDSTGLTLLPSAELYAGNFSFQVGAGGGNLFQMVAIVPEPSVWALIALALALSVLFRRRPTEF